jgi:hypothetical protein
MQVLQRLRLTYSAADYATGFLEAAIKKAGIPVEHLRKHANRRRAKYQQQQAQLMQQIQAQSQTPPNNELGVIGNAISIPATAPPSNAALTPPPDMESLDMGPVAPPPPPPPPQQPTTTVLDESDLQLKLESFLQAPPSPHHDKDPLSFSTKSLFPLDSNIPDFSMPDADDNSKLDAFLGGHGDCDPFLGHDGMPGMFSMDGTSNNNNYSKPFEFGSMWSENGLEDMSKILDGVDLSFDDVIQVLETEIN